MKRTIWVVLPALVAVVFILGSVLAQGTSPEGIFSGIITKVDPGRNRMGVQNQKSGEMVFQLDHQTRVNGFRMGEEGLIPKNLQKGMQVTVYYVQVEKNWLATQIEVKETGAAATKGWEVPFGCGYSVC